MSKKRMLIDASHPEETRVVIVNGARLEDLDVELASRKPLKGNIYLAKVTRVEPSLQAAFVDFGGNRHGFLAFNEIHPDYYQIPVADREALLADEEKIQRQQQFEEDEKTAAISQNDNGTPSVEELGGDEISYEVPSRHHFSYRRRYKIQEVVKRRQILLVQVVKEERGTKGAALTTYLSLAGRYCVLMPNTARGGGISRKITNGNDRKRLKMILNEMGIPEGMAVIVRTAGSKRTKTEIKRDYEYLSRLWGQIRELTLKSIAPFIIHEEGNLIKRSIRDLYTKDIDEIIIDGEEGYRTAKDFMKMLIPSHAKRVQPDKENKTPLMQRYQVANQLENISSPQVHLKSGGYIVISPTEALVSIDVNSGRSTKERNIEETALKTNLEAAEEIARHLKLRDLAGLIVIDFIDMENQKNQTKVERTLKEAMRYDRAKITIGRISPFGLLELSRQRLRSSLIETISEPCPYCSGSGTRRSTDSSALQILRVIEEEVVKQSYPELILYAPTSVALYILNYKREKLAELESGNNTKIYLKHDDTLIPPDYRIEKIVPSKSNQNKNEKADVRKAQKNKGRQKEVAIKIENTDINQNKAQQMETGSNRREAVIALAPGENNKVKQRRRRNRRIGQKRRSQNSSVTKNSQETPILEAHQKVKIDEDKVDASSKNAQEIDTPKTDINDLGTHAENANNQSKLTSEKKRTIKKPPSRGLKNSSSGLNQTSRNNFEDSSQKRKGSDETKRPDKQPKRTLQNEEQKSSASVRLKKKRLSNNSGQIEKTKKSAKPRPSTKEKYDVRSNEAPNREKEAARTNVIEVGGAVAANDIANRRGWWRRPSS
ncbi:MAG: Ribonuclease E [Alphaproteobacteria bacterium MarineAlpha3_Bin5]|nr:ribonuclease E/G [Magnetovibrio sp.]PPR76328.1 MAG: Ribonuclease E [Alphaproteobacteria bacterium MarineAlpha3_Bin5]